MAYASKLSEEKFNQIYDILYQKSEEAAYAEYVVNHKNPGIYPSDWSRLFDLWLRDRVSNLHVYDCLNIGYVYTLKVDGSVKCEVVH